jgi:REP element-mobilizing transposase RayT
MPRAARLDILHTLNHVIVRGIERNDIFLDDEDRHFFLSRFAFLLKETETECLAWALMRNHVHLLLRPKREKLSTFMRRMLTGYAVTFNLRHHRCGHLFQNRYKSIVCEEDPYLLELVRYIHLNPLRVGAVADVNALDRYPWTGHSVLMGRQSLEEQASHEVLRYFGTKTKLAREAYRCFVADGVEQGNRKEFGGGGLRRVVQSGVEDKPLEHDERVLGSSEFIRQVVGGTEKSALGLKVLPLPILVNRVARVLGITPEEVKGRGRSKDVVSARGLISFLGYKKMGYSGEAVASVLGISRSGVCRRTLAGEQLFQSDDRWRELFG